MSSTIAPHEYEFVSLDDLLEVTVQSKDVSDGDSAPSVPIPIISQIDPESSTPTFVVHKSTRTIRPRNELHSVD